MNATRMILLAVGAAALVLPAAAGAQTYYGQPRGYDQPRDYDQPRGDWRQGRYARVSVFPEFRPIETHIRREIQEGVRDDMLARDDAADLMGRLQQIQAQEMREYRVHGRYLPNDDRMRIRSELDQLDHLVDQTRYEP